MGNFNKLNLHFILPAFNEAEIIKSKIAYLKNYFQSREYFVHVVIVENGSTDETFKVALKLCESTEKFKIEVIQSPDKGMGYAYALGFKRVSKDYKNPNDILILSAMDLPFDFTDFEGFCKNNDFNSIIIGSKGHPESQLTISPLRQFMSMGFFILRWILLGMKIRDTQGTIFIPMSHAIQFFPKIQSKDFFFSTELCFWAQKFNIRFIEVPIKLEKSLRPSSVKIIRDSIKMLIQLVKLRFL